jgi:short-subunit dehydrogenase
VGGPDKISILVNNVEIRDPKGAKLHKTSDKEIIQTINTNTFPTVFMTRFLGPALKERNQSELKSAIINMTSVYSFYLAYNSPIFTSSKSFCDVFS